MGSGLILLIIVGAWLAVLVPMGLRSHDSATSLRSADRFSDAMRVLSRRPTGHERTALMPRRDARHPVLSTGPAAQAPVHRSTSLVVRRRRTLLALLGAGALALVAGLVGPGLLLVVGGLLVLAAVLFSVHCRRQAVLSAERRRQRLRRERDAARRATTPRAPLVTGIPSRMPERPAPPVVPAARHDEPVPVPVQAARTWQPVPVPLPTYVGKDRAPARPRAVLDLTRPGHWSAGLEDDEAPADDYADELDAILERRRAVGGW